jgi:hypothetical protein
MTLPIVTLAEARERNLLRYFTGIPCKKGHISERYTLSNNCLRCCNHYHQEGGLARAQRSNLKRNYGITVDRYNALLEAQEFKCAICNRAASEFKRSLHVDHCHETGRIRGLLCVSCNNGIGCFKEKSSLFQKALVYLAESSSSDS